MESANLLRHACAFLLVWLTRCSVSMPKLLLISMDGFRHDYLDLIPNSEIEHFQYMIQNGVKAKAIMNVFPTSTYPNHYTLITGLYPESHGIVHNEFFDPVWNEFYDYANKRDNVDSFWYDNGAEPIYVTNKKAGGLSGSVVWPSGIGKVRGIGPDKLVPGADAWTEINNTKRVETLISWFTDENPINLGLLYFLEPDETGHETGAGSLNVINYIKGELNNVLGYLMKRLNETGLLDDMNIILTSDHGFVNYTKEKSVILNHYLNSSWYTTGVKNFTGGVAVHIFPSEGQEDNILNSLRNVPYLKVYRKGDTELQKLHYSSNDRIPPIVITGAEEGVVIFLKEDYKDLMPNVGLHGYSPYLVPDMRPFFIAMGPAFKKGYVSKQFNSVDIYPLMCHILGIKPAPNNGSFENVKGLLREDYVPGTSSLTGTSSFKCVTDTTAHDQKKDSNCATDNMSTVFTIVIITMFSKMLLWMEGMSIGL